MIPGLHRSVWVILLGASLLLSLAMGMRQSMGLFLPPVTKAFGLAAAEFTLAIAIQNMVWGLSQPFVGALADRLGLRPVMLAGGVLYALGLALMHQFPSAIGLLWGPGVLIGLALSCTASVLSMSAVSKAVPASQRSLALGVVSAFGSVGTLLAAPLAQWLLDTHGLSFALLGFGVLCLLMLPAAWHASRADQIRVDNKNETEAQSMRQALHEALSHGGYRVMAAAYFVCGLQLVFLTNHLPNYLQLCGFDPMLGAQSLAVIGLFNVMGSYACGWLGQRYRREKLLGLVYLLRSAFFGLYFLLPPSTMSTLIFAAAMGLLWLGVVPLVNGLVSQLFGVRYMATLTGVAFLSHQLGSFLGAWGGGLIYDAMGNYDLAWQFAVGIGVLAGLFQLGMNTKAPIRLGQTGLA
jgi:predicted MFS family arabinose efflux permease